VTTDQTYDGTGWYIRDAGPALGRHLWHIAADTATRMDVTNPTGGPGTHFTAKPCETIWEALGQTGWFDDAPAPGHFHKMTLAPGHYYPRIARPLATSQDATLFLPDAYREQRYILGAQNQLAALIDDLRRICRVVQPTPDTLNVYGHEIRNLLILAATEVEMHWRGILRENGQPKAGKTAHYVALADPMRLRDYIVHFHPCPDIAPVTPFVAWDAAEPSQSLPWYDAYNGVKHNREFEFEKATIGHAFCAIAGCAVMLVAQFGDDALTPELSSFLSVEPPAWPIGEMYLYPQDGTDWERVPHPDLT